MNRTSLLSRSLSAALAALLLLVSAAAAYAVTDDYASRSVLPQGVTIQGQAVGGMTYDEAKAAVEDNVAAPLLQPLSVGFDGKKYELPTNDYLSVDVDGMVASAIDARSNEPLYRRVIRRITREPVTLDVPVKVAVDQQKLSAWVDELAGKIDRESVDATRSVEDGKLVMKAEMVGYSVVRPETLERLTVALTEGRRAVSPRVKKVKPKYTTQSWEKTIVVIKSERRLWLYHGDKLEKTYPIAVGTPGYPTPSGWWTIVNKVTNPTWTNPGSTWAKGMPKYIGPGPGNPLGTRALYLDAPGIRIHGTNKDSSIGTAASHGCMRMHMWDVEDLYPRVPIGTTVIILP